MFDVGVAVFFGIVGYFMLRYGYAVAAAALGVILGANIESSLRQGLLIADNNPLTFVARPVTAIVLALALLLLTFGVRSEVKARRAAISSADSPGRTTEHALVSTEPDELADAEALPKRRPEGAAEHQNEPSRAERQGPF